MKRSSELEWLRYFYDTVDMGPAHGDVVAIIKESFEEETGMKVPIEYEEDE